MNDDEKRALAAVIAQLLYHELGAKSSGGGETVDDEADVSLVLTLGLAMLIEESIVPEDLQIVAEKAVEGVLQMLAEKAVEVARQTILDPAHVP